MATKRMTRLERQALTRKLLLDSASTRIAHKGFGAATIEDISALAGLTRGAFYSNFANKEELFLQLLRRQLKKSGQALEVMDKASRRIRASTSNPASREILCDNESFILWTEAILHAWRDKDFNQSFISLVQEVAEVGDLSNLKSVRRRTQLLARQLKALINSSNVPAPQEALSLPPTTTESDEKILISITVSLEKEKDSE